MGSRTTRSLVASVLVSVLLLRFHLTRVAVASDRGALGSQPDAIGAAAPAHSATQTQAVHVYASLRTWTQTGTRSFCRASGHFRL
eukprot:1426807-Pleurochrysis_carterae.AAC.2